MPKKENVFKKSKGVIFREIEGENVLIPVSRENDYALMLYGLNETGRFIWEQINGSREESKIVQSLIDEFEIDEKTAKKDVGNFLSLLKEKRIISF